MIACDIVQVCGEVINNHQKVSKNKACLSVLQHLPVPDLHVPLDVLDGVGSKVTLGALVVANILVHRLHVFFLVVLGERLPTQVAHDTFVQVLIVDVELEVLRLHIFVTAALSHAVIDLHQAIFLSNHPHSL